MRTFQKQFVYIALPALLWSLSACKDSESGGGSTFNRKAMLQHYAANLIQPAYAKLQSDAKSLSAAWDNFQANPDEARLASVRAAWRTAYESWQSANAYNFGPAGEDGIRKGLVEEIGTFPVNEEKTEALIAAGELSFNNFNRDTRGFPTLEYLLFSTAKGDLTKDAARRAYAGAVVAHLQSRIEAVASAWNAYAASFVAADGTDVGSSASQLYNEFVRSFESVKNFKVGLPAGKRPGQTQAEPQLAEAFYSGLSLEMLKAHLAAIERMYYGRGAQSGPGWTDYLQTVTGGPELIAATEAQWQTVKAALAAVPSDRPLSVLMQQNDPSVEKLHTELQKQTRFFKSDMSSILGIAITYSSGDGD